MLDLDEALERFHKTGPVYASGLVNHGPMALEALFALGHKVLSQGLIDVYLPRLRPHAGGTVLTPAEQATALGDRTRFGDWLATFERELDAHSVAEVTTARCAQWIDGVFSACGHAFLRTAHAVRALSLGESAARRRELAHALAFWAAYHRPLPSRVDTPAEPVGCEIPALASLAPWNPEPPLPELFSEAAERLHEHAPFMRWSEWILSTSSAPPSIHDLCVFAAEHYLEAETPRARLAYNHALTIPSALRLLESQLSSATLTRARARLHQAVAALHLLAGASAQHETAEPGDEISSDVRTLAESNAELRYRAACSLDEHVIKFVEACIREDAHEPHDSLRLAAAHAALHQSGMQPHC